MTFDGLRRLAWALSEVAFLKIAKAFLALSDLAAYRANGVKRGEFVHIDKDGNRTRLKP